MLPAITLTLLVCLMGLPCNGETKFRPQENWKKLFVLKGLGGWKAMNAEKPFLWAVASKASLDRSDPRKMAIKPESGTTEGILVNGPVGKSVNLITEEQHGDVELYLEFMVPKGSNSGVYLQGLYEVQVLDSYGKKNDDLKFSDCGGIYARYINKQAVGGTAPSVNASRAPGEWQNFHIWFRAPRFDANGNKTENARFVKVIHNAVTLHENVDLEGPTRAHMLRPESPLGPLMLQGDHGPVAYRNIYIRPMKVSRETN